jgi:hypothetical protein
VGTPGGAERSEEANGAGHDPPHSISPADVCHPARVAITLD